MEWSHFMDTWKCQGTTGQIREFDEEGLDADCIQIRVLTLREAEESMERGVSERDNPSTFLT
jgi:hypothetical protein